MKVRNLEMLVNGEKIIVIKDVASFLKEGDIAKVVDTDNGMISFAFGDDFMHKGIMSTDEFEKHFKKYEEPKVEAPSVSDERIEEIISNSTVNVHTAFGKCTIVSCQLPNGFVIVESSSCVSPENYNKQIGIENCMNRIIDKVYELEGYRLQEALYNSCDCDFCDEHCECCECECDDYDECTDTDLDCDDCDDEYCPFNPNF
jgi:hypothetical protein